MSASELKKLPKIFKSEIESSFDVSTIFSENHSGLSPTQVKLRSHILPRVGRTLLIGVLSRPETFSSMNRRQ